MRKIKLSAISLFLTMSVTILYAEIPFSLCIETKGGTVLSTNSLYFENEIAIEKEFPALSGFTLGLENSACHDGSELANETTLGFGIGVIEHLSTVGLLRICSEVHGILLGGIGAVDYDFEDYGLLLCDENELVYMVREKTVSYVNTFQLEKAMPAAGLFSFYIALENEFIVEDGFENTLLLGPGASYKYLSIFINYLLSSADGYSHGAEAGVVFEF
jgi:hypothetical protein